MQGLLINGVDSETLGLTLGEVPGWLDLPSRDITTSPILGRQGLTALADASEGARRLTLSGTMRAPTAAQLRPRIDAIKLALLAKPLSITFGDNDTRTFKASLTAFTMRSVPAGAFVQEGLSVDVVLTALDPYAYDIALQTIAFGARLPLGTGVVRPVVTINGVAANPWITLYSSAGAALSSLQLTITTVGGDTLVVDMDAKTIKLNGASVLSALTGGDFFAIDPSDQANFGGAGPYIGTTSGVGNITYYRTWR